jgi:hypothetical protein
MFKVIGASPYEAMVDVIETFMDLRDRYDGAHLCAEVVNLSGRVDATL